MPFLIILAALIFAVIAFLGTPSGKGWLGEFRVKLVLGKTRPGIYHPKQRSQTQMRCL